MKRRRLIAQLVRQRAYYRAERDRLEAESEELKRQKAESLLGLIGAIVISWAKLENLIDLSVGMIHHTWGRTAIQHDLPPSLDRELDYMKSALRSWKFSTESSEKLRGLLPRIHALKTFRHDFVHGLADIHEIEGLPLQITTVKGAFHRHEAKHYSVVQIQRKTEHLVKLVTDFTAFTEGIASEFIERQDRNR